MERLSANKTYEKFVVWCDENHVTAAHARLLADILTAEELFTHHLGMADGNWEMTQERYIKFRSQYSELHAAYSVDQDNNKA